jgi:hypothetical protein
MPTCSGDCLASEEESYLANNFSMALKASVVLRAADVEQEGDRDARIDEQHNKHRPWSRQT